MLKTRKVIFWGREDLLGRSVEIFLSERKEWEIVRLCNGEVEEELFDVIERERPNVVILYLERDSRALPTQLIQCYPGIKVIALDLDSNEIETYHRQKVCINAISDLLSAVED